MGYNISPLVLIKTYTPTDDVIVNNEAITFGTVNQATYELLKEITIESDIGFTSLFRFKFTLGHSAAPNADVVGAVFRNGVRIGAEHTNNDIIPPGSTYTEDIVATNWIVGDKIQLWAKSTGLAGRQAGVSDFKICGVGSEFKNTLV